MNSFALYLSDGTLFGVYGQAAAIYVKTASSIGMLVADITLTQGSATAISFGATSFANPPASQTVPGVVQLATQAEAAAGTDAADVLTPATASAAAAGWVWSAVNGWISTAVSGVESWVSGVLAAYVTITALTATLAGYVTNSALVTTLAGYVTNASLAAQIGPSTFGSAGNGHWEQRASGVLEQWGRATINLSSEGVAVVSFPKPFPLEIHSVVISPGITTPSGGADGWLQLVDGATSLNGFEVQAQSLGASWGVPIATVSYIAKGR